MRDIPVVPLKMLRIKMEIAVCQMVPFGQNSKLSQLKITTGKMFSEFKSLLRLFLRYECVNKENSTKLEELLNIL